MTHVREVSPEASPRVPPDRPQDLPAMLATPQMPLPRLFSTLAKMDPSSKDFLPTLDLFLRSKEERELLVQLEGSTAVYAANILDMVRSQAAVPHDDWTDFCAAYGYIICVSLPPGISQAHPPPHAIALRVVGGITYLLRVTRRSETLG
jgi:hypothetical protein